MNILPPGLVFLPTAGVCANMEAQLPQPLMGNGSDIPHRCQIPDVGKNVAIRGRLGCAMVSCVAVAGLLWQNVGQQKASGVIHDQFFFA